MELVDIYNKRHEKLGYTKERKNLSKGEYRLSCFVWIVNDENKILIQQRLSTAKKFPNMWETVSGGAKSGEDSITGALTEVYEELGISLKKEDLIFIGSFIRFNDFVEIFMANTNFDINDIKIQKNEVQNVKLVNIEEYEKMIKNKEAVATGYLLFVNYYKNYYKKSAKFIDGKLVYTKD